MENLKLSLKKYLLEDIRYVSYLYTKDNYVFIDINNKNEVLVNIEPKFNSQKIDKKEFLKLLDEETKRSEIYKANMELREYIIKSSMCYKPITDNNVEGLTPEEEKELDKLIAEVEQELKSESVKEDKLEIKKTWEEKYGDKNKRK